MTNASEYTRIMSTLLRAIAKYTYKRILSTDAKLAYKTAMDSCLSHIEEGWTSLDIVKKKIEGTQNDADLLYKKGWLLSGSSEKRKYYLLACEQAIDVISSIERRFITGGHSFNPTITIKENYVFYEDDQVFDQS